MAFAEDSCMLVFIQCRDREWWGDNQGREAWAWESAEKCLRAGFGVVRVPTQNWADVKQQHPDWFAPCWDENQNRQHI